MNRTIDRCDEVIAYLQERGHSRDEIEKVLDCVATYDETTLRDALFDELGHGSAFLDLMIARAVGSPAEGRSAAERSPATSEAARG
jgi:hypothetical protein